MIRHQLTIKRSHLKLFVDFTNHLNVAVLIPEDVKTMKNQKWCDVVCIIEKPKEEHEKALISKIYDYLNACKKLEINKKSIFSCPV